MSRIFISYKRVDKDKVFNIKDQIESALDEKCWIDLDGIESDAVFASKIIGAINYCEVFLFMYSKVHKEIIDYENDWTIRELNFAQDKKKRIVFINIDGSDLTDWFKLLFGTKQQVDALSGDALSHLIKDLCKWLCINKKTGAPYDIFICYRRIDGAKYAHMLQYELEGRGFRTFADNQSIDASFFRDHIENAIKTSSVFIVILSKEALTNCCNEDDWVRKEILLAISERKHIIPVNPDGLFDGIPPNIPQEMIDIFHDQHFDVEYGKSLKKCVDAIVNNRIVPVLGLNPINDVVSKKISRVSNTNKYLFVAYISYSDRDSLFAKELHSRLENFSYRKGEYHLRPIFFSSYEPLIGDNNALLEKISESHFFILICSPSVVNSPSTNKEIEYFSKYNNTRNICPIIVEGEPYTYKDNECYPNALKQLFPVRDDDHGVLGVDARNFEKMTKLEKDILITKIASFLLGVPFDDIWKHRRQTMRIRFLKILHEIAKRF